MGKSKKYYVVWEGQKPGIYDNWNDCKLQTAGYPNARYKSFKTLSEAQEAYQSSFADHINQKSGKKEHILIDRSDVILKSISVDAACSGNPGIMEYRGVDTDSGDEIFRQGPFKQGTNNIGEFLALVHALAMLRKLEQFEMPIYTDSRTALVWVRNKRVKTTLQKTRNNKVLFQLMDRAITWLNKHSYKNPIIKWDTKRWGEIPADFGRK